MSLGGKEDRTISYSRDHSEIQVKTLYYVLHLQHFGRHPYPEQLTFISFFLIHLCNYGLRALLRGPEVVALSNAHNLPISSPTF